MARRLTKRRNAARTLAEATRSAEEIARAEAGERKATPSAGRPSDVFLGEFRRRDIFPLMILHFISSAPTYGKSIMTQIEDMTAGVMSANPNTIYPLLRELESRGLVRGQWEHPEKRSRRFYTITEEGEAEYARLREAVRPFLDSIVRSVNLMKDEIYG